MRYVEPVEVETDLNIMCLTNHAAERQQQRDVTRNELWAVVNHGRREPSNQFGERRWKYIWGDLAVITNSDSSQIITVLNMAGPMVELQKAIITQEMENRHGKALERLQDKSTWTSHTVAVVDTSGSMRKTDTEQGFSRSEMVWLTLAVDVAKLLKSGERGDSDIFSLVGMLTGSNEIFSRMPFDWILYNKLVDMQRTNFPLGNGDYFPALAKAASLLKQNQYGGCSLALIFLADGMPSDRMISGISYDERMQREISRIASRFGSRLTVLAMPLGAGTDHREFATLKALVNGAKDYGCKTVYTKPSLSAHILGTALTKLSSTVTGTTTAMEKRVCRRFRKEPMTSVARSVFDQALFEIMMQKRTYVYRDGVRIATWTIRKTQWQKGEGWVSFRPEHTFHDPRAAGVAIKKAWFGEGAERLVKEIRELDSRGNPVGPFLVAKDTKYIHNNDQGNKVEVEKDFHKRFMKCQRIAKKCAKYFNRQLARHPAIDPETCPQIEFLDCSVFMIQSENGQRQAYLVEKMLDIQRFDYQRWNSNDGGVKRHGRFQPANLIENAGVEDNADFGGAVKNQDNIIALDDIPQAFSCFSYWWSRRHFLVCDLQGILNKDRSPPTFELTDPCVHHRMSSPEDCKYGRTDHGVRGIQAFLSTHRCSQLCRMIRSYAFVALDAEDHFEFPMIIESPQNGLDFIKGEHTKLGVIVEEPETLEDIQEEPTGQCTVH